MNDIWRLTLECRDWKDRHGHVEVDRLNEIAGENNWFYNSYQYDFSVPRSPGRGLLQKHQFYLLVNGLTNATVLYMHDGVSSPKLLKNKKEIAEWRNMCDDYDPETRIGVFPWEKATRPWLPPHD